MPEEAQAPELPPEIVFRLDNRGQVIAHIRVDGRCYGRYFPLKHQVVQALLFCHFRKNKGCDPKRREMRRLNHLATVAAVEFLIRAFPWAGVQDPRRYRLEDWMERETIIPATLLLLEYQLLVNKLPWTGNLTKLRQELECHADANGLDRSDWPGGKHLGEHILTTLSDAWPEYNVRIIYRRKSYIREYCLDWIDREPVIRKLAEEGRMTQDDATGAYFASPEDEGDFVEDDEPEPEPRRRNDPLPEPFTRKRPRKE